MVSIAKVVSGTRELLLGNEAIARGALEAGVKVGAGYPGTPSSEIIETLARFSKEMDIYVEWSVNEKVAVETAASASFAGLRAISAMKHAGLNVAMDFLMHLNYAGTGSGGLVIVVCDDPAAWSSPDENDSRIFAKWAEVPLLEPATAEEAKEMTKWAFDVSERINSYCLLRSVTRLSHTSGSIILGEVPSERKEAHFDTSKRFSPVTVSRTHPLLHKKLEEIQGVFESSSFNWYKGPASPELVIVASGSGWLCSLEALKTLGLEDSVGILKLGTLWPLPLKFLKNHLAKAPKIFIVEELDPFIEDNLKAFSQDLGLKLESQTIYGKSSGHLKAFGELSVDQVIGALSNILGLQYQSRDLEYNQKAQKVIDDGLVIDRDRTYCPGCPHRATLWSVKNALRLDDRNGVLCGDIGCYVIELFPGGNQMARTHFAMGSGAGVANGLGKLRRVGFKQPVISLCGDSTFYHASIPALIDAKYNQSNFVMVVLDNTATAMTGFQPHPGTGSNAKGDPAPVVDIEAICQAIGVRVEITDPFDISGTTQKLLELMKQDGVSVLISRRKCELIRAREEKTPPYKVWVDATKCKSDDCGCANYCTRIFKCPGLLWDEESGKTKIDEMVCAGCGVCADICPESAIVREAIKHGDP